MYRSMKLLFSIIVYRVVLSIAYVTLNRILVLKSYVAKLLKISKKYVN